MSQNVLVTTSMNYDRVAWFYERLAGLWSLGKIRAAKASQICELAPGQKLLYVGVGSGEDAVLAANAGVDVTCIDLSSSMLEKARHRINSAGHRANFVCCDIMEYRPDGLYDAVAANFFLNIFPEQTMRHVLGHLASLVRPGGKIMIADFAPPRGSLIAKTLEFIYYEIANLFFWTLRLMPLHPVFDYSRYFAEFGLALQGAKDFGIPALGLYGYRSLVAVRVDDKQPEGEECRRTYS